MKRIICFINSLGGGGAQRQLVGLAILLKEKGYDVKVVAYHGDSFYVKDLVDNGVSYLYLKKAGRSSTRLLQVARYFRKDKPDVVISYIETPNICGCFAKIFNKGFRLIVSERSSTLSTGLYERFRFNIYRFADYVVPNSFAQTHYIEHSFPFLSSKLITISNFVDLDYFTPSNNQRQKREIPQVIVAATISERKNTLRLIEVAAILKGLGYRFHIRWYGLNEENESYIKQCNNSISSLLVEDCFQLMEKTTNIKECYLDADYFCLPSFYEGTPNVICEAMACGLPVACSEICDNGRFVSEGENGFLFNPNETTSIVEAFKRMLSQSDQDYVTYCHCSREKAENLLSKDKFVDSYVNLIEKQ